MASSKPSQNQAQPAPVTVSMRRRTTLACTACRKRKIRCIPTEQGPKSPYKRCTTRGLKCEYVAATDEDYSLTSRPPSSDTAGGHRAHSWTNSGPFPVQTVPFMTPAYSGRDYFPSPASFPVANPISSAPDRGFNRPYAHPQYYMHAQASAHYVAGDPNSQHDAQHQYIAGPVYASQPQSGNYEVDYSGGDPGQSSSSSIYPSNDPRYH
ncbi:hypothetical protein FB451DRAFT_1563790 [Mycena latifolia]|nr:hypothetical protein FB451DRAFT_1563790 [Mycena latifolia]